MPKKYKYVTLINHCSHLLVTKGNSGMETKSQVTVFPIQHFKNLDREQICSIFLGLKFGLAVSCWTWSWLLFLAIEMIRGKRLSLSIQIAFQKPWRSMASKLICNEELHMQQFPFAENMRHICASDVKVNVSDISSASWYQHRQRWCRVEGKQSQRSSQLVFFRQKDSPKQPIEIASGGW